MAEVALIFDLDGTLIDSAPDIHAAVNLVMTEAGIPPFAASEVRGFIGNGVEILIQRCVNARGLANDTALQQSLTARFLAVYETAHTLTILYPNVAKVLAALPNPLAICTNKPEAPTRSVLAHFGLSGHFAVVVGGDTLAVKKPDPTPLRETIRRMGAPPALFIGDSEVDAATARAADVPFVLFTLGYRKTPADQMGAVAQFDDWRALPDIVARLTGHPQPRTIL